MKAKIFFSAIVTTIIFLTSASGECESENSTTVQPVKRTVSEFAEMAGVLIN